MSNTNLLVMACGTLAVPQGNFMLAIETTYK